MSMDNISELSQERTLITNEIYEPNDFYGHATILKRYIKLDDNYQIKAAIEHGAGIGGKVWDMNINNPMPAIFTSSCHRANILKCKTKKKIFVIGPKIKYANHFLETKELKKEKNRLGTNLLSFPAHSTHHIDTQYDIHSYCLFLKRLGKDFDNIRVCLYWKDILMGIAEEYQRHGIEVVTAGHMFDSLFLPRLKSIIETATLTTSNFIGTILGYCCLMGKPHFLVEGDIKKTADRIEMLQECTEFSDQEDVLEIKNGFNKLHDHLTQQQKKIVNKYWGVSELKSRKEMKAIIDETEELYQKASSIYISKNKQENNEYLFDGNFDEVLLNISQIVKTYPRRIKGKLRINNKKLIFADLHSFYHQAIQIFKSQIYGFKAEKENPVIVDCGAHIGLASIYFAEQFPKGEIYAYEADPEIANILSENLQSFGLDNVKSFPKAIWINDKGVSFNNTNDDSGFIRNFNHQGCVNIPSVRLRGFLKDKEIDLLKLDIEGAEYDVIDDCAEILGNVKNLIIEVHKFREQNGSLGRILSVLEKNNFEYTLDDFHSADWVESQIKPPFDAVNSDKYIVTVFAWQKSERQETYRNEFGPTVESENELLKRCIQYLNKNDNDNAFKFISYALNIHPDMPALNYAKAIVYARTGQKQKAMQTLRKLLENQPDHKNALILSKALKQESEKEENKRFEGIINERIA